MALAYVGRFATSRVKLSRYLERKLRERGWIGETLPDIEALVADMVRFGYLDDAGYAETQARSLTRRGYGARRVDAVTRAAGISDTDRVGALMISADARIDAALRFAEKKRWGPFASDPMHDPARRQKAIGAFLRAGHDARLARQILDLAPGAGVDDLE